MKIETSIKPRKDGTVRLDIDGSAYVFKGDSSGALVTDVENEEHITFILSRGDDFLPANEDDFAAADALINAGLPANKDDEKDDEKDGADGDSTDLNAAPIEEPASAVASIPNAVAAKTKKDKK